ncbi:hypothetical protein OROMI_009145 [Orobanche minor]
MMSPQESFEIKLHGFFPWASVGFLMPVSILIKKINREESEARLRIIFYVHAVTQIQEARRWYLGIVKSAFRFDHCWVLLKDQEKWKSRDQLCGIKRKKSSTSSNHSTQETVNLGEECDDVNKENFNKRPGGRKAAKEKKRLLGDVSGFTTILCELKDEKQKSRVEKIEKINLSIEQKSEFLQLQKSHLSEAREANRIQNEKLQMQSRIENEKLQLERDREDMNIMMKDLSSLDEEQKKYFQMRRMEILGRVNGMQVEL